MSHNTGSVGHFDTSWRFVSASVRLSLGTATLRQSQQCVLEGLPFDGDQPPHSDPVGGRTNWAELLVLDALSAQPIF